MNFIIVNKVARKDLQILPTFHKWNFVNKKATNLCQIRDSGNQIHVQNSVVLQWWDNSSDQRVYAFVVNLENLSGCHLFSRLFSNSSLYLAYRCKFFHTVKTDFHKFLISAVQGFSKNQKNFLPILRNIMRSSKCTQSSFLQRDQTRNIFVTRKFHESLEIFQS